jgi:hypothetical protein
MLVASLTSKQLGRENTIETYKTQTILFQGDPSLISMSKLLERGMGVEGWGTIITPQRASLKRLTFFLMAC